MNQGPGRSTRPSVPPVVWLTAGVWAGIAGGEAVFTRRIEAGGLGSVPLLDCVLPVGMLLVCVVVACWVGAARLPIAGLVTGALLASLSLASWTGALHSIEQTDPGRFTGIVASDPTPGKWGWTFELSGDDALKGWRLEVTTREEPPAAGCRVTVYGRVQVVDVAGRWGRRSWRNGSLGRVRGWRVTELPGGTGALWSVRADLGEMIGRVEGVGGSLLAGLVLGDRRSIPGDVAVDFRSSGLSHLLAVSGLHLGLVALGSGRLLRAVRLRRGFQHAGIVASSVAFAAVTGWQTPTIRALLMVVVVGVGTRAGRRGDGLGALAVAVATMLVWSPMSAFSVSLRLSVSAVGGLIVFARLAEEWLLPAVRVRWAAKAIGATVVAQCATAPIVADTFHVVSLIAPPANLIAVPAASVALGLGIVGAVVAGPLPTAAAGLFRIAGAILGLVAAAAEWFGGVPYAATCVAAPGAGTWLAWATGLAAMWWLWPRVPRGSRAAGAIAVALALAIASMYWPGSASTLWVADVGQADAIIVSDGGETMVVDCGAYASSMAAALGRSRVRRVDVLVLTHAHDDHTGGIDALVGTTSVGWIGVPTVGDPEHIALSEVGASRLTPRRTLTPVGLQAGMGWWVGDTRVTVLWPDGPTPGRDVNDTSVVLLLERGEWSAILGGDAEEQVWGTLAAADRLPDIDVLKAAHHGSANGTTAEAMVAMSPEVTVVSVGEENQFGHPDQAFLLLARSVGAEVLRTDLVGDVVLPME